MILDSCRTFSDYVHCEQNSTANSLCEKLVGIKPDGVSDEELGCSLLTQLLKRQKRFVREKRLVTLWKLSEQRGDSSPEPRSADHFSLRISTLNADLCRNRWSDQLNGSEAEQQSERWAKAAADVWMCLWRILLYTGCRYRSCQNCYFFAFSVNRRCSDMKSRPNKIQSGIQKDYISGSEFNKMLLNKGEHSWTRTRTRTCTDQRPRIRAMRQNFSCLI